MNKNRIWTIFFIALFIAGCSTLGSNSFKNNIALNLSSGYLHFVDIRRNNDNIFLTGKINKPLGKDLSRTKIVATFIGENNKIISQIKENVIPNRTRLHKGRDGRFVIKIPYDPTIKSCELGVEWD